MTGPAESVAAGPAAPALPAITVGDLLRRAAGRSPSFPALRIPGGDGAKAQEWDYSNLLVDSERCAHGLLAEFQPGERIAVWADNRPEWVVLQFAAALAGLVLVPVNPAFKEAEAVVTKAHDALLAAEGVIPAAEAAVTSAQAGEQHAQAVVVDAEKALEKAHEKEKADIVAASNRYGISWIFSTPTPCSPVIVPPTSTQNCRTFCAAWSVFCTCDSSRSS